MSKAPLTEAKWINYFSDLINFPARLQIHPLAAEPELLHGIRSLTSRFQPAGGLINGAGWLTKALPKARLSSGFV